MCHDLGVGPFRYLLFLAVAVSLSVYLYRGYRRWIAPPATTDAEGVPAPSADSPAPTSPRAASPVAEPAKPPRSLGFTNPSILPADDRSTSGSESLVEAVIREELARKRAEESGEPEPDAAPTTGRSGLFAPDERSTGSAAERVSVAAALTGVRLPDDLVPFVGSGTSVDPHQVLFLAPTLPAAEVGRALGDELERLGYRVASESDVVAVATKGSAVLRVALHPDPANERVDGVRRFPTAPASGVVIEFTT